MTLASLASDPTLLATFDRIVALVCSGGAGITMRQLGAAHALARELQAPTPDRGRISDHAHALGIDPDALEAER